MHDGTLRFVAQTELELNIIVCPRSTRAIPPGVVHNVQPLDQVHFSIDFLSCPSVREGHDDVVTQQIPEAGGETACWAHLLCPECGAVLDGGSHLDGCGSVLRP